MPEVKNSFVRLASRGESLLHSHIPSYIPSLLGSFLVNWATSRTGAGTTSYTYYEQQLAVSATHLKESERLYLMPPAAFTGTRME